MEDQAPYAVAPAAPSRAPHSPLFASATEAAESLVPEGWTLTVVRDGCDGLWNAACQHKDHAAKGNLRVRARHHQKYLAIGMAALKAIYRETGKS